MSDVSASGKYFFRLSMVALARFSTTLEMAFFWGKLYLRSAAAFSFFPLAAAFFFFLCEARLFYRLSPFSSS